MSERISNCCGDEAWNDQIHEQNGVFSGICRACGEHCEFELEGEESKPTDFTDAQKDTIAAIIKDASREDLEEPVIEKVHIAPTNQTKTS